MAITVDQDLRQIGGSERVPFAYLCHGTCISPIRTGFIRMGGRLGYRDLPWQR